jgi:hypothetical protein
MTVRYWPRAASHDRHTQLEIHQAAIGGRRPTSAGEIYQQRSFKSSQFVRRWPLVRAIKSTATQFAGSDRASLRFRHY